MQIEYKVLWLDDQIDAFIEDEYVDEIKQYLEDEGFEAIIETADNATAFFEKIDNSYDLILTDYHMEEMNGDEVVQKIRNDSKIFSEILFYTAKMDLKDICKIDRVSFLQTESQGDAHEKAVVKRIKFLIDLTIQKFHDIVVMRGMIMNETSDMDNQKLEMIKKYISKKEISETNVLKNDILKKIDEHFTKKLECVNGDWKNKDNGLSKLIKDNFVFSADYKIQTLGWILNKLSLEDFSECYKDEIINLRNKFAHATLLEEKDENEKVIRKYFKHGDSGITFDEALCKTIRTNITKHKKNLKTLKNKLDE